EFLNKVVTSTNAFEGGGRLEEYVGGYDDWLAQRTVQTKPARLKIREEKPKKEKPPPEKRRLSYKERLELQELPPKIEALEKEKHDLTAMLSSPSFYADKDAAKIRTAGDRLASLDAELAIVYNRWDELEHLAGQAND
ncbi:MAG: ABC transporter ATP-binding protein, partial [Smithellaceae bacterium]